MSDWITINADSLIRNGVVQVQVTGGKLWIVGEDMRIDHRHLPRIGHADVVFMNRDEYRKTLKTKKSDLVIWHD